MEKYQDRLYATLTTRTLTSEETGKTLEMEEYVFEGIGGIAYFSPTIPATAERDSYTDSVSDEAISDGHMSINIGDETSSKSMEGTIYVSPTDTMRVYYFNPVYQSADGSVYLTSGSGLSSQGMVSEGFVMSQTLDASYTVTENGKTKTESISVTLSVSVKFAPEKIVILQMDADSILLSRTEYAPDALPEAFTPEPDAAYLVVETHRQGVIEGAATVRDIYGWDDETIETFFARADGICVKQWTQIMWPD